VKWGSSRKGGKEKRGEEGRETREREEARGGGGKEREWEVI